MTDKQIIIDGIDVSECIYFKMNNKMPMCRACNSGVGSPYCEYHKDCYYKQLKRKEQECEKLKAELKNFQDMARKGLDEFKDVGGCWGCGLQLQLNQDIQDIKQLKAENDELKEKVKELRQGWINCDNERNLQEANSEFRQRVINRYKQTLMEIEEIAKNMNNECFYDDFDCEDCDMKNGCTYQGKITILQKIKEVESENT